MDVILLERIEKLGQMGEVVKVKPGYARNYLLPQKKALRATKDNLAYFETQRTQLEAQNLERRQEAERVAEKLEGLSVAIIRQAGDSGQLYGSTTARDIAEAVTEAGVSIDRGQVVLDKAIKMLGLHQVRIRLHPEVSVEVTVNVARSESEAQAQAEKGAMVTAEEQVEAEEAAIEAALAEVEQAEAEEAAPEQAEAEEASAEPTEAESEEAEATAEPGEGAEGEERPA